MAIPKSPPTDKAGLRRYLRAVRRGLGDQAERSASIWQQVIESREVVAGARILAYASVLGEPDTAAFIRWAIGEDKEVMVPEDDVVAAWPDVVIVPGLGFTRYGDRLGQGGGWYDRFLSDIRPDCHTIGVAYREQLLDHLPVEPHDVRVDRVVTDRPPTETR